jgi:hypothetical protein
MLCVIAHAGRAGALRREARSSVVRTAGAELTVLSIARPDFALRPRLSQGEFAVLTGLVEGKTHKQIALERGVPALIVWLILLGVYVRMLWRIQRRPGIEDVSRGIAVGALGGTIGFFTSGLVHYNWGDSEVVTIFYFIMGLCLVVERTNQQVTDSSVRV